jgi:hypothetical protein
MRAKYEYTLAGTRACSETFAFVAFGPAVVPPPSESGSVAHRQNAKPPSPVEFSIAVAPSTKSSHVCPSVENNTNANIHSCSTGEAYSPRFAERVSAATPVPRRPSGGEMLLRAPIKGKIESVTGGISARGGGPVRLHPRVSDSFFDLSDGRACLNYCELGFAEMEPVDL